MALGAAGWFQLQLMILGAVYCVLTGAAQQPDGKVERISSRHMHRLVRVLKISWVM